VVLDLTVFSKPFTLLQSNEHYTRNTRERISAIGERIVI